MKSLRLILVALGILLLSAPAWADSAPVGDPRVIIGGGMGSLPVGFTFLFGSPSGSSPATSPCTVGNVSVPDCVFQNSTSTTFTSLTLDADVSLPQGAELECGITIGGPFTACSINTDADGVFATFTGGPGVLASGDFSVTVDGWNPDTDFGVGANGMTPPDPGTPEPGTIMLTLTGLGALALALRRRMARTS